MKNKLLLSITAILFFGTIFSQPVKSKKPINVSELTITQIHAAYKKGVFTSQKLVAAYIGRINQFDKQINSISAINPKAIAIAKAMDEEYKKTKVLRPLHGIPIIVKDNIQTKGLATTAGALALKDFIPNEDAFVIEKLIKAGAIVIAKSNMAEWAFTPWASFSSIHGLSLNPYNLEYTTAGSSGGTGASVAANFGTLGLGTDTGSSIRGPSSHNSLVGFRTTMGLISREGIVPLDLRNDVVGPMCRTTEDATRVLEIMVGYDAKDAITKYSKGKVPANYTQFLQKNGLKGARIGVLRELSEHNPDPEVKALFEKAIIDIRAMGAVIIDPFEIPNFSSLKEDQWCEEFKKEIEIYLATHVKNDTIKTLADIIRIGTQSKFVTETLDGYTKIYGNPKIECRDAYTDKRRIAFRKVIEEGMDKWKLDAVIYPTWNKKPIKINAVIENYGNDVGNNSEIIAPHTGQPAFTVPMGFSKENLPAGLQFLSRMYAEPTLIKLAYAYEQNTKHRIAPIIKK